MRRETGKGEGARERGGGGETNTICLELTGIIFTKKPNKKKNMSEMYVFHPGCQTFPYL